MCKGIFITVEGGEGVGKTTAIEEICIWLYSLGMDFIKTREPGGIPISESIREVILDRKNTMMDGRTEALLYAASRRQHLVEKVIPALNDGKMVICDRFVDSSIAYQGHARGIGMKEVETINAFAIDDCVPQLTILLDLVPEVGLARLNKDANREINRLDLEKLDFHTKVREGYNLLLEQHPERIVLINANQEPEKVVEDMKDIITKKFFVEEQETHQCIFKWDKDCIDINTDCARCTVRHKLCYKCLKKYPSQGCDSCIANANPGLTLKK